MPEMLALFNQTDVAEPWVAEFSFDSPPTFESLLLETPTPPIQPSPSPLETLSQNKTVLITHPEGYEITHVRTNPHTLLSEIMASRHHKLYKDVMLKVMQDTYACCALYITKNPISAPVITSHIYSCYQELILSLLLALTLDLGAHTRALLICHIMHLFNPNLYNALTTSPFNSLSITVLESAASLLFSSTIHAPHDPLHILLSLNCAPGPRQRNLMCDGKLGLLNSWYSSAYVWNAGSALDFVLTRAKREHYIMQDIDF
ncbi:hypothetical protein BJX65DRAFT_318263 [Aspergillus insuetus]